MKYVKGFKGVYSSNNIPTLDEDNTSLIINFDKVHEPGSHFVAVYRKNNNKVIYFDPLKLGVMPIDIARYLNRFTHVFDFSTQLQSDNSTYCGFFCILFILCLLVGEKYWKSICLNMKLGRKYNDEKCIKLICKTVKMYSEKIKRL